MRVRRMLRGDEHAGHRTRPVVPVQDGDLRLAVRSEHGQHAPVAERVHAEDEHVRQYDRQGHQLRGLVARVADHDALVAGPLRFAVADARADLGALPVQSDAHHVRLRMADPTVHAAHQRLHVRRDERHLAEHVAFAARARHLDGRMGVRVRGQDRVQDRVGDQVAQLVRMPLGDRLRGPLPQRHSVSSHVSVSTRARGSRSSRNRFRSSTVGSPSHSRHAPVPSSRANVSLRPNYSSLPLPSAPAARLALTCGFASVSSSRRIVGGRSRRSASAMRAAGSPCRATWRIMPASMGCDATHRTWSGQSSMSNARRNPAPPVSSSIDSMPRRMRPA